MHKILFGVLLYITSYTVQAEHCIRPEQLLRTAVRLTDDANTGGSAWFLDTTHVATVEHVVSALGINAIWKSVTLTQMIPWKNASTHPEQMDVRVVGIAQTRGRESLIILELSTPFVGAQIANVRENELEPGEHIMGVGYPGLALKTVTGTYLGKREYKTVGDSVFVEYQLELYDDEGHRDAFAQGASGSPLFDCEGRVVFTLSHVLSGAFFKSCSAGQDECINGSIAISFITPPGSPTNLAVSSVALFGFSEVQRTTHQP